MCIVGMLITNARVEVWHNVHMWRCGTKFQARNLVFECPQQFKALNNLNVQPNTILKYLI